MIFATAAIMQEGASMPGSFRRRVLSGSLLVAALVWSPWSPEQQAFAQEVPSSARAGQRSCAERTSLRSQHSREPTRITFINRSGMYRGIMWIDTQGGFKNYGGLNSGGDAEISVRPGPMGRRRSNAPCDFPLGRYTRNHAMRSALSGTEAAVCR
jgi:hypothetical protein